MSTTSEPANEKTQEPIFDVHRDWAESSYHKDVGPIKSTKLRRALIVVAERIAAYVPRGKCSIGFHHRRLSPGLVVKVGSHLKLEEAYNQEYVRTRTSVPVPQVHCAFTRKGITYIVMEYIHGKTLFRWWRDASPAAKETVLGELEKIMVEMRRLPNPFPGRVSGFDGGPIFDYRYARGSNSSDAFGPFKNAEDFHLFLRYGFRGMNRPVGSPDTEQMTAMTEICRIEDRRGYSTVLTHGDLSGGNIIIRNNKVAGIIDWAGSGWFPDYWEYTSAWHGGVYDAFWRPEVGKVLHGDLYEMELKAEKLRHQYYQTP